MSELVNKIKDTANCFVPHSPPKIDGSKSGVLEGLTFTEKDLYDIKGFKTGNGNPAWLDSHKVATDTAEIVKSCLNAGATMVGKVICDEFFYSFIGINAHYGTPINSSAPDRIPGGSSSGSAASVAANISDFSLGSDTGGSVRIPAAFCGLYGLRPTFRRLNMTGATAMAPSFDTAGWFARDLDTFLKVGSVLLDENTIKSKVLSVQIAQFAFDFADDEIAIPLQNWLHSDNCKISFNSPITKLPNNITLDEAREAFRIIQAREIWEIFGPWIERKNPSFGPGVKERMHIAKTVTLEQYNKKIAAKNNISVALESLVQPGTLIALPVTASLPINTNTDLKGLDNYRAKTLSLVCLASLAGLPQISIPVTKANGVPISLGLIGWKGGDESLLDFVSERF